MSGKHGQHIGKASRPNEVDTGWKALEAEIAGLLQEVVE